MHAGRRQFVLSVTLHESWCSLMQLLMQPSTFLSNVYVPRKGCSSSSKLAAA